MVNSHYPLVRHNYMRTVTAIMLLTFSFYKSFGLTAYTVQTDSVKEKIQLINTWVQCLDTLSPFQDGDWKLIDSLNTQVEKVLFEVLNDKNIVKYKIDTLIHLNVTKSADNKVFIFSFYENTGGSYKSNVNIIHYRLSNGQPKAKGLNFCEGEVQGGDDYGGTIDKIIILKANNKTKYLALGGGVGCSTCEFDDAFLFNIDTNDLQTDFCLHVDFRQGDGELKYNPKDKTLSYNYTIYSDDSIYGTDCLDGQKIEDNKCKYRGQYKFNGDTFVEVTKK